MKTAETFVEKPKTLAELRAELESGVTTAADRAAFYYDRIAAVNPHLNVYLSLSKERAMEQAARVDALAAKGDPLPALAGVPVGIKDVLTMRGVAATAGSKILQGYRPPYDCTAVARLEAAGAVLLGKLNCDEFAMGSSNENSAYGPVRNPVDIERVPGGSSGGSAAAVAANMAVATLGTDTGGSIRQPASFCGVVGVLPTWGRVSRYGLIAFASSLDRIGPFAGNVRDAATLLGVIAGHDAMDATSSPQPAPDYAAESDKGAEGLRIGVPAEYFAEGLDADVRAQIEKGIDALKAAGCDQAGVAAPHEIRHTHVLPGGDGGGQREPGAVRRRAVWVSIEDRRDAERDVQEFARRGIWRRGEAAHSAGHVRAVGGLLRRLLRQGAAGAALAGGGVSAGICRGGRDCYADVAGSAVQAGREDGRSAVDVPGGYLYRDGEPGGDLRGFGSVWDDAGGAAGGDAGAGEPFRGEHVIPVARAVEAAGL